MIRFVQQDHRRAAFTLIEMLIVIAIISITFAMTATAVSFAISSDVIPSTSRQIQAALMGAKDRAIRAGGQASPGSIPRRGIRFMLAPNNSRIVNRMVFVGSQDDWTQGKIDISSSKLLAPAATPPVPTGWDTLMNSGMITDGARIKIPDTSAGVWYRVTSPTATQLTLTRNYSSASASGLSYRLQLAETLLSGEEPIVFPSTAVINLDRSIIPADWYTGTPPGHTYVQNQLQIMFNSLGNVAGPTGSGSQIFLYLCTRADGEANLDPADPKSGDKLAVRITPQTGAVAIFPIDITDSDSNIVADDPFKLAK